jgi:NAD(P)H dehydrogenase (quinone)
MMYAVTGASGQLGRLVIEALLRSVPADRIVAAVRDPAKVNDLRERGVVVREADYDRPETLGPAFDGVDHLLLISSTEVEGRLPQHQAVIEAAKTAGISLLAYTSMLHAATSPARLATEHRLTEQAIKASGIPAVILRNGWYAENHLMALPIALEHGAFIGAAGDGRFSSAARADYAEAAAVALTSEGQAGRTYELAADHAFTMADLASDVSRQAARTVVYNDLSEDAYRAALMGAGLPANFAALVADADVAACHGALFDDSRSLSKLIGRPTASLESLVAAVLKA